MGNQAVKKTSASTVSTKHENKFVRFDEHVEQLQRWHQERNFHSFFHNDARSYYTVKLLIFGYIRQFETLKTIPILIPKDIKQLVCQFYPYSINYYGAGTSYFIHRINKDNNININKNTLSTGSKHSFACINHQFSTNISKASKNNHDDDGDDGDDDYKLNSYDLDVKNNGITMDGMNNIVKCIYCGAQMMAFITKSSELYGWGRNMNKLLEQRILISPTRISSNTSKIMKNINPNNIHNNKDENKDENENMNGNKNENDNANNNINDDNYKNGININININSNSNSDNDNDEIKIDFMSTAKCGGIVSHMFIVCGNNDIYGMGYCNWGQLGIGNYKLFDKNKLDAIAMTPRFQGQFITQFAETKINLSGSNIKNINNNDDNDDNESKSEKIVDIVCGYRHSIFLTNFGNVYSCGDNLWGQCGHKTIESNANVGAKNLTREYYGDIVFENCIWEPKKVNFDCINNNYNESDIKKFKIVSVDCGVFYTFCLDNFGNVWVFGQNHWSNLCIFDNDISENKQLKKKMKHIVALEDRRDVYSCIDEPVCIPYFKNKDDIKIIKMVINDRWCCNLFLDSNYRLYFWSKSQLNNDKITDKTFEIIDLDFWPKEILTNPFAIDISIQRENWNANGFVVYWRFNPIHNKITSDINNKDTIDDHDNIDKNLMQLNCRVPYIVETPMQIYFNAADAKVEIVPFEKISEIEIISGEKERLIDFVSVPGLILAVMMTM